MNLSVFVCVVLGVGVISVFDAGAFLALCTQAPLHHPKSAVPKPASLSTYTACGTPKNDWSQIPTSLSNPNFTSSAGASLGQSPEGATGSTDSLCHAQAPPIPGVVIPDIGKGPGAWKKAVKQWEEVDLVQRLLPLRDWPKEWYTGSQRTKTGAKHGQHKLIGLEFEWCEWFIA
ncbi:hypothetical protein EDD18DRAFT_1346679 [Armillaria luteobubalina]|uniref:Uncharacterized protein n=1 Tax=Armillaria luteobubalina TaxID=153913 RepID=A0AA39QGR5_9AGAR|nr:hypothetical protein EDD18DRAFT_1346679 [Armillaria luteobubalina]